MSRSRPIIALLACSFFFVLSPASTAQNDVADMLQQRMEELQFSGELEVNGAGIAARQVLPAVYAARDFQPLWTDPGRIEELLALVETAPDHGLQRQDYYADEIRGQLARVRGSDAPMEQANLDVLLTESLLRFGYHQLWGKVNAAALDPDINFDRDFLGGGPVENVPAAIRSPEPLQAQLRRAVDRGIIYRTLQQVLKEYRQIAEAGGWPQVAAGATLRKGDKDPRVVMLRKRLNVTGDLAAGSDTDSDVFDDALEAAVIAFQERHALNADGVVGAKSYEALSVPVEVRMDQLRLSLERLRWVRGERTDRFVAVNIPSFRAFYVKNNEIAWEARAMIGKNYRQTPVFRGDIAYIEINPTWTVPPTILRNDVLPAIKRDPDYLKDKNMTVIDRSGRRVDPATVDWQSYSRSIPYLIRQEPGANNALGEIKFIFPNKHAVFLHDTPQRHLFSQPERAFSSGCIRVENPFELAELVLNEPDKWNQRTLGEIRNSKETRRIKTQGGPPVVILYLTASLTPDGRPQFLRDLYQRDARVLEALNGTVNIVTPPI